MDIGIFPISAKPFHEAHYKLIEIASNENDAVVVVISLTDRIRSGEFPIYGKDMALIWRDHLSKILPKNVRTLYLTSSPIKKAYEILGKAEEENQKNQYRLYGDTNDIEKNFQYSMLVKYYPTLTSANLISLCPYDRKDIKEISGTMMREYLSKRNMESFCRNLPEGINKEFVYSLLLNSNKPS
jgi:citrate lyase synthetase